MIGDILFYRGMCNLPDELIELWEGSTNDFVHCAVDMGDGTKIEALFSGITRDPISNANIAGRYINPSINSRAIQWIEWQVGKPYGYGDLMDIVLNKPIFTAHMDCSDLCCTFLHLCGDKKVLSVDIPHLITPQQLSIILGVK